MPLPVPHEVRRGGLAESKGGDAAGQGIAVASIHMLEADLASGRLAVVRPFRRDGTRYVGLSRRPFQEDPRKSRFLDWLAARMEVHLSDHLVD